MMPLRPLVLVLLIQLVPLLSLLTGVGKSLCVSFVSVFTATSQGVLVGQGLLAVTSIFFADGLLEFVQAGRGDRYFFGRPLAVETSLEAALLEVGLSGAVIALSLVLRRLAALESEAAKAAVRLAVLIKQADGLATEYRRLADEKTAPKGPSDAGGDDAKPGREEELAAAAAAAGTATARAEAAEAAAKTAAASECALQKQVRGLAAEYDRALDHAAALEKKLVRRRPGHGLLRESSPAEQP